MLQSATPQPYVLLAEYNQWFNAKMADVARGFQSSQLMVQLNHIHVMDCLWLSRFGLYTPRLPPPAAMDDIRFKSVFRWYQRQREADTRLLHFVRQLSPDDLTTPIELVTKAEGEKMCRPLWALLTHLFNHQSLHRGELVCELAHGGVSFGQSDVLPFTPACDPATPPLARTARTARAAHLAQPQARPH